MLTSEEERALQDFRVITGFSDRDRSIEILRANNWNLEQSALQYYQEDAEGYNRLNQNSNMTYTSRLLGSIASGGGTNNSGNGIIGANISNSATSEGASIEANPQVPSPMAIIRDITRRISGQQDQEYARLPGSFPTENDSYNNFSVRVHEYVAKITRILVGVPIFIVHCTLGLFLTVLNVVLKLVLKLHSARGISVLSKFQSFFSRKLSNQNYSALPKKIDHADSARSFVEAFNSDVERLMTQDRMEELGGCLKPDFLIGGYTQALYLAKKEAKWLLVYIQSDEHEDKDRFISKVLTNTRFNKLLKDNDVLVWGGNCAKSEAYQAGNSLNCARYPFLSLLCLCSQVTPTSNGTETSSPVLSVVSRVQGYHPVSKIVMNFSQQMEKYGPSLVAIREDLKKKEMERKMREAQNLAYERSLLEDMLKKKKQEAKLTINLHRKAFVVKCLYEVLNLNKDFKTALDDADNKKDFARIAIRLPTGRVIKYIRADLSLYFFTLYCDFLVRKFIDANDNSVQFDKINAYLDLIDPQSKIQRVYQYNPNDYEYEEVKPEFYKFKAIVFNTFPKEQIPIDEHTKVKDCKLLYPSGNLMIEFSEEDSSTYDITDEELKSII